VCADDSGILHGYTHAAKEGEAALGFGYSRSREAVIGMWLSGRLRRPSLYAVISSKIRLKLKSYSLEKARYKLHVL
jgi:hypothetical protein